jgi:phosphohistidine phosphatase
VELILVRHAAAEDGAGRSDAERRLTTKGEESAVRLGKVLHQILSKPMRICASPYERARKTAKILAKQLGVDEVELVSELATDSTPRLVVQWLHSCDERTMIVVGHEPTMSALMGLALTGREDSLHVEFKKSAACSLAFDGGFRAGEGRLRWFLPGGNVLALSPS